MGGKHRKTWLATADGNIYSHCVKHRFRKLVPVFTADGYHRVYACRKKQLWHRFVWEFFHGPIPKDKQVNHKDGNKTNNRLDNLELISQRENLYHAMDNGLHANPRQKIQCVETGEIFLSQTDAAKSLRIHQPNISKVLLGERKRAGKLTFRRIA